MNILDPDNPEPVTIDRHILNMLEYNMCMTRKRYYQIVELIREKARDLHMIPNQLQAVLWETFKRLQRLI